MRILLDHCVDWRLGRALPAHDVAIAQEMGWDRLRNGKLLAEAAARFDVLLTVDRKMNHQQNLTKLPLAVVVIVGKSNKLRDLLPAVPLLEAALRTLQPCTLIEIVAP